MGSRGVNKVILIGNITKDVEIRYLPNGNAVANFSVATNESWKDAQGQPQERTEFHNIVMYKRLAEIAGEYLKKGSKVYLEGKLQTSKWQDATTGQDRYKTEINASELQMLDSKPQDHQGNQQQSNQGQQRPAQAPQQQRPQQVQRPQQNSQQQSHGQQYQQPQQNNAPDLGDGWTDDAPF